MTVGARAPQGKGARAPQGKGARAPQGLDALLLAREAGSAKAALALLSLSVAQRRGLAAVSPGWRETRAAAARLHRESGGALPPWPLPLREPAGFSALEATEDELVRAAEELSAESLGRGARRKQGLYYTPPEVAAQVVALAREHGGVRAGAVLDPCAGAGAFLLAAARAGFDDLTGFDLDGDALRVARAALWLSGIAAPRLVQGDALLLPASADLVLGNPPYGHVELAGDRAALGARFPALRGGEVDRYAAFLLRSLELVRPGGVVALLVPDTWMSNARNGRLRSAVLASAEVAALVDLGKPFAAAKDTRVQAVVLVRSPARRRSTFVGRGREALARAPREELERGAATGFQVYRSTAERALCAAMERASLPLGEACSVGYGLRTGDNQRHVARRAPSGAEIGLVGGEDIEPFALRWRPKTLCDPGPLLSLVARQQGRPRVAIQRIRTNAKTPWARWLEAAPVGPDLVCLDSLSTFSCESDERLWALLGLVSSVALNRWHRLRTTDVNVKPSALRELPVPQALLRDPSPLAALARARAAAPAARAHLEDRRIDALVYRLFQLEAAEIAACEDGFWGERAAAERALLAQA